MEKKREKKKEKKKDVKGKIIVTPGNKSKTKTKPPNNKSRVATQPILIPITNLASTGVSCFDALSHIHTP